jgi:hypothetical protein
VARLVRRESVFVFSVPESGLLSYTRRTSWTRLAWFGWFFPTPSSTIFLHNAAALIVLPFLARLVLAREEGRGSNQQRREDVLLRRRLPAAGVAPGPALRAARRPRLLGRRHHLDRRVGAFDFSPLPSSGRRLRFDFQLYHITMCVTSLICRLPISCICPCCLCVTVLLELAVELVKAPIHVMTWFTSKIPC